MLSVPIEMKTAVKKPTASVRISRRSDLLIGRSRRHDP
jgi:hypothetical protein